MRPRSRSRPRISAAERPEDVLSALHNIKTDRMLRKLDLFEELDRDKDELVTADEVVSYLRHHNVEVEVETVVRLFEDISHDASQEVVNLHDFSVALGRHSIAKFDTPGKRLSQRSRRPAPRVRSAKRASRALAKTHPATHTQASGMTLGESPPHQPPLSPVNGLPSFPPDLSARRSYSSSHTAAGSGLSHADARSAALQAQLFAATGENGLEELGDGAVASILARKHGAAVLMRSTFLRVQHRRLARAWRQWSAFVLRCRADKDVERKAQETVRPPLHAVAPAMAAFPDTCSPSICVCVCLVAVGYCCDLRGQHVVQAHQVAVLQAQVSAHQLAERSEAAAKEKLAQHVEELQARLARAPPTPQSGGRRGGGDDGDTRSREDLLTEIEELKRLLVQPAPQDGDCASCDDLQARLRQEQDQRAKERSTDERNKRRYLHLRAQRDEVVQRLTAAIEASRAQEEELTTLRAAHTAKAAECEKVKEDHLEMAEKASEYADKVDKLRTELAAATRAADTQRSHTHELAQLREELADREAALLRARQEVVDRDAELAGAREEARALRGESASAAERLRRALTDAANQRSDADAARKVIDDLRAQLKAAHTDAADAERKAVAELQAQLAAERTEAADALAQAQQTIRQRSAAVHAAEAAAAAARRELEAARDAAAATQGEELARALEAARTAEAQLADEVLRAAQLDAARADAVEAVGKAIAEAEAALAEAQRKAADDLAALEARLDAERGALEEQLAQARADVEDRDARVAGAEAAAERLRADLAAARDAAAATHGQQLADAHARLRDAEAELGDLHERLAEAARREDDLAQRVAAAEESAAAAATERDRAKADLDEAVARHKVREQRNAEAVRLAEEELGKVQEEAAAQRARLDDDLRNVQQAASQLESKLTAVCKQRDDALAKLDAAESPGKSSRIAQLDAQAQAKSAQVASLEAQLEAQGLELMKARKQLSQAHARIKQLEAAAEGSSSGGAAAADNKAGPRSHATSDALRLVELMERELRGAAGALRHATEQGTAEGEGAGAGGGAKSSPSPRRTPGGKRGRRNKSASKSKPSTPKVRGCLGVVVVPVVVVHVVVLAGGNWCGGRVQQCMTRCCVGA